MVAFPILYTKWDIDEDPSWQVTDQNPQKLYERVSAQINDAEKNIGMIMLYKYFTKAIRSCKCKINWKSMFYNFVVSKMFCWDRKAKTFNPWD